MAATAAGSYMKLSGSSAFSPFRLARIAKDLGAVDVRAIWVHFVHLEQELEDKELNKLEQLLDYGDFPNEDDRLYRSLMDATTVLDDGARDDHIALYHVSPRRGTISPWSSLASKAAHNCGLEPWIKRIERGMIIAAQFEHLPDKESVPQPDKLHDRMTQEISRHSVDLDSLFSEAAPAPAQSISLREGGSPREAIKHANRLYGLGMDDAEIDYLAKEYPDVLQRNPVDIELYMFAQVNSEHCRHKQFNADWTIDGMRKPMSLFNMIRNTHEKHPHNVESAYEDNAAVLKGTNSTFFAPDHIQGIWTPTKERVHYLAKVETHNHPTAVSPFPGAATGSGGEIRDEGAVGRGSKPKAGLAGFSVSDLNIPGFKQPWELDVGRPGRIASSLDIMLEAPIGSAAFNNEFGRPCTTGYFRTLLTKTPLNNHGSELRGYHKPIMIAGGVGTVRPQHAIKEKGLVQAGDHLIVIGGPAMLIGLGGGAASSVQSGDSSEELDFASVQRGNPEVQRRAQEVINACTAMGAQNPIRLIHDVGAGGLSNAFPEIVHDAGLGGRFELRNIDNANKGMSPLQIWCCEAQERYVMVVADRDLDKFKAIAQRERCAISIVGQATDGRSDEDKKLELFDRDSREFPKPIDLPMSVLFGKPPKMSRIVDSRKPTFPKFDTSLSTYLPKMPVDGVLGEAIDRVLTLPAVGSKSFLITIGDRTVGGLTVRDQMVGPWQVPVADCSVTATSLMSGVKTGEAMAIGEKPTLALISAAASARMAVAESIMNLSAAHLKDLLSHVHLSANWMAASSHPGEGAALYEAVEAIGMDLCPKLGISIPVGKDSMSMKMKWKDGESNKDTEVTAPLSLVITAFGLVENISSTWTPALKRVEEVGESILLYVDLVEGKKATGGSALAQVFGQVGNEAPDVRDPDMLRDFVDAVDQLHESGVVLAYHDRSDGGLFTTLVEMAFAGRCGIAVSLDGICASSNVKDVIPALFNEELGAVFQVRKSDEVNFKRCFASCGPPHGMIKKIGVVTPTNNQSISLRWGTDVLYRNSRSTLQQRWASTSYQLQKLRDNPACADSEFTSILDDTDPGLSYNLTFNPKDNILPWTSTISQAITAKPRVAILREQGVNGHAEMAFAFHAAGFAAVDVHMTDLISGRVSLASFVGLAACGGFSYGDVLGAGQGWAKSVLLHAPTRKEFQAFFERKDTFTLGVCNGCQFLSRLKELIPGAESWPTFERNTSEQYEARVCMVEVLDPPQSRSTSPQDPRAPSVFLHGMAGSTLPIVVAHGEGRAAFPSDPASTFTPAALYEKELVSFRYVDNRKKQTETYPFNPNGSPMGITGVRTPDGRVLAMMPHPERTVLRDVASWTPRGKGAEWGELGPWGRLFRSARKWVG
ncbi:phosphoribosylformylglycinamidine synthase-like protein [Aulographum hederae CBS 113979]|uniref:Phosphoribosylformylglycinamidine synthase n=1 Tax=Aulographum hederae CBS 113979 TaxID=1176131 RepID=A0A6G1HDV0_9PEZI|nr:phosphoribosylformylglycinamidine synthase-like protein [Aulographum hederae CBS 113979]